MNRALDKPAEQARVTGADDGPVEFTFHWLTAHDDADRRKLLAPISDTTKDTK